MFGRKKDEKKSKRLISLPTWGKRDKAVGRGRWFSDGVGDVFEVIGDVLDWL